MTAINLSQIVVLLVITIIIVTGIALIPNSLIALLPITFLVIIVIYAYLGTEKENDIKKIYNRFYTSGLLLNLFLVSIITYVGIEYSNAVSLNNALLYINATLVILTSIIFISFSSLSYKDVKTYSKYFGGELTKIQTFLFVGIVASLGAMMITGLGTFGMGIVVVLTDLAVLVDFTCFSNVLSIHKIREISLNKK